MQTHLLTIGGSNTPKLYPLFQLKKRKGQDDLIIQRSPFLTITQGFILCFLRRVDQIAEDSLFPLTPTSRGLVSHVAYVGVQRFSYRHLKQLGQIKNSKPHGSESDGGKCCCYTLFTVFQLAAAESPTDLKRCTPTLVACAVQQWSGLFCLSIKQNKSEGSKLFWSSDGT